MIICFEGCIVVPYYVREIALCLVEWAEPQHYCQFYDKLYRDACLILGVEVSFPYGIGQPGIFRGKVIPVQYGVPPGTEHYTASHIPDGTVGEVVHIVLV